LTDRRYLFHPVSRRNFLQTLEVIGCGGAVNLMGLPVFVGSGMTGPVTKEARAFFELVPSSLTGITWKHFNGRSPQYYLPETTGAG
jgi:enediyne biosynthesis protein E4